MAHIENSTLRILRPDGKTVGTGFLVNPNLVVTCAHVVAAAEAVDGDTIQVQCTGSSEKLAGLVDPKLWRDVKREDVAFLRLESAPEGAAPLPLGMAQHSPPGSSFRSFGYASAAEVQGIHANGTVDGCLPQPRLLQLQSPQANHGISGGPVFDEKRGVVIGMISSGHTELGRNQNTTFAIPCEQLFEICPEICPTETCPYLGLETFSAETARFFFGREALTEKLVATLRGGCRFLAVFGPSGSGKSSVVRAGLLPRLAESLFHGWQQRVARPAHDPLLQEQTSGLANLPEKTILFVDQFEELFTVCPSALREQWVRELTAALGNPHFVLVISMRNDFYPAFQEKAAPLAQSEHLKIENVPGTLQRDELLAIMEGPAKLTGLTLEEGLAERMLADLARDGDTRSSALPLLEFALTQLWQKRRSGFLTHDAYELIGGVTGSLARWADEAYSALPPHQQPLAENLFTLLTHLGDEAQGIPNTRKRRAWADFDEATHPVIQHFAGRRLIITGSESVELVHDSLLREWGRLQAWLEKNLETLRILKAVGEAAHTWNESPTDPDLLIHHGGRLDDALKRQALLSKREREYLMACLATQNQEQRARDQRRRALFLASIIGITILALLGSFGWYQMNLAALASQEASEAQQERFSALALNSLNAERSDTAMLISVQAYQIAQASKQEKRIRAARNTLLTVLQNTNTIHRFVWEPSIRGTRAIIYLEETLLYGDENGDVMQIDSQTYQKAGPTRHHNGPIQSMALSPGGETLVVASCQDTNVSVGSCLAEITIWNMKTGQKAPGPDEKQQVNSRLVFSPDGKKLLFGSGNKLAQGYLPENRWLKPIRFPVTITALAFSPDGQTLAVGLSNGNILITQANDPAPLTAPSIQLADSIRVLTFHPNGRILAVGTGGAELVLYQTKDWTKRISFPGHANPILDIVFRRDGGQMASTSVGMIKLIDFSEEIPHEKRTLRGYSQIISNLAFAPQGDKIASTTQRGLVIWNLEEQPLYKTISKNQKVFSRNQGEIPRPSIHKIVFSEGDQTLAFVNAAGRFYLHDLVSVPANTVLHKLPESPSASDSKVFAISPDANSLAYTAADPCQVLLFAPATQSLLQTFSCNGEITALAFSPDNHFLAAGTGDGHIHLWNIQTGLLLREIKGNPHKFFGLAFSPDAKSLATSGCAEFVGENTLDDSCTSGEISIWNTENGDLITKREAHSSLVRNVVFSPNGRWLASAGRDGAIALWDASTLSAIGSPLIGHITYANTLAFSPDSQLLASAGADFYIFLWDVSTGQPIGKRLTGHTSSIGALTFNHRGDVLASGDNNGNVFLWNLAFDEFAQTLCARAGRNLTRDEWSQYFPDEPYQATCPQWPVDADP